ncbi:tripartite tricarboxylate transporter TctB family protein [Roseovarius sp. A-2]|uniref:tripartite tricarboxylate transporter TctB family protein n=1 Tax=Roseovarius sp. A-2 TaxID=1570360 RepID=UPI0009B59300|nr:tripartite tricarboxylate transporter TctB family protein [Roseovarius sp. A-2]GAW36677.1 tripartite tricarboxylate transporter TctB family protein [Roseovarius sp. A-2]
MPDQQRHPDGHIGSLVISVLFVIMGIIALYDTTGYSDRDSQVFPRTVAILMILTAGLSFVTRFLHPRESGGFGTGTWWRRILLIVTMFAGCLAIPHIGFLASGVIAFAGGLIAAMHDRWTLMTAMLYAGSGAAIMIAFFSLFRYVLHVPLP